MNTKGFQKQVFLVDDESSVRETVARTLRQEGIKIRCFVSGQACLDALRRKRCALLIADVQMPDFDGITLVRKAKEVVPGLLVMLVTGYGDIPLVVKAMQNGVADFIEKPLERDEFLNTTKRLLERAYQFHEEIGKYLTKAEMRVLYYIVSGKTSKEIAILSHRNLRTIELHRQHIFEKLGVTQVVHLLRKINNVGGLP
jgi:two-component system response regulator TtrR